MGEVLRASLRSPPLDEEPGNEVVVLNGLLTLGENPRGGSLMLPRTAGETEGFFVGDKSQHQVALKTQIALTSSRP